MASASGSATTTVVTTYSNDVDIGKFNRGAITTIFTPPASCFVTPTLAGNGDCTSNSLSWDMYYYSPAVSCPSNFYAASTVRNSYTGFQTAAVLSLGSDTSVYICCPTGYTVQNYDHVCTSKFAGTTVIEFFKPTLNQAGAWTQTASLSTSTLSFPGQTPLILYADGVPIWFQSSDKAVQTTSASSGSTSTTTSPTTVNSNSAIVSPTTAIATVTVTSTPTISPNTGLSTGAKAGIGAGTGIIVLGIAFILAFFFLKRRKRGPYQTPDSMPTEANEPKELHDTGIRAELHNSDIKELSSTGRHEPRQEPSELAG